MWCLGLLECFAGAVYDLISPGPCWGSVLHVAVFVYWSRHAQRGMAGCVACSVHGRSNRLARVLPTIVVSNHVLCVPVVGCRKAVPRGPGRVREGQENGGVRHSGTNGVPPLSPPTSHPSHPCTVTSSPRMHTSSHTRTHTLPQTVIPRCPAQRVRLSGVQWPG